MSQAEDPKRVASSHQTTLDDVRALMGASTPHFALQLRNRIQKLIEDLPADSPARLEGEREITRLDQIAYDGEIRGHPPEDGLEPLPSVAVSEIAAEHA